jgi:hypothetical protein
MTESEVGVETVFDIGQRRSRAGDGPAVAFDLVFDADICHSSSDVEYDFDSDFGSPTPTSDIELDSDSVIAHDSEQLFTSRLHLSDRALAPRV